jgi:hypothetical protein
MGWLELVLTLLPSVIQTVEAIFSKEPKSGAEKKATAMQGLTGLAKGMEAVTTGGAKDTWKEINANMPAIGTLIDSTVSAMNKIGLLDNVFNESTN